MQKLAGLLTVMLLAPAFVSAHSGGLNAQGCHNNRKTGGYHCHRSAPVRVKARDAESPRLVKKSKTGICHAPGTTYYARTKRYTSFETLAACLGSGGRLPKR